MLEIIKDPTFAERNIPLGILEVTYPDRSAWDITKFYDLVHAELDALREKYADYDRKAVFGENPYFRFFKKFKKTYPVMQQFESVMFKGRPFPEEDPPPPRRPNVRPIMLPAIPPAIPVANAPALLIPPIAPPAPPDWITHSATVGIVK